MSTKYAPGAPGIVVDSHGTQLDPESGEELTGELNTVRDMVVPDRAQPIELMLNSSTKPIHLQKAQELNIPPKIVSSYVGIQPEPVGLNLDKVFTITGAVVYFSGPFTPKDDTRDGSGYYKILLKTDIIRKRDIKGTSKPIEYRLVLMTSGKHIAGLVLSLIDQFGWYDWEERNWQKVVFSSEGKGSPEFMMILDQE